MENMNTISYYTLSFLIFDIHPHIAYIRVTIR